RGVFTLGNGTRPLVLIGAGIGITPLLAMLYAVSPSRPVRFLYTTRDEAHFPFRAEVQATTAALSDFHGQTFYTSPSTGGPPRRLTAETLHQQSLPVDGDYYLCGPPGFMADIAAALQSLGIPATAIKQEAFGNGTVSNPSQASPHLP